MGKLTLLQVGPLPSAALDRLLQHGEVTDKPGPNVRGIVTRGKEPITTDLLDQLPALEIISCLGAGTDGLDMEEIERRGISVATTSRVLAADVADIAMGLAIALARGLCRADRFVRDGRWSGGKFPLGRALAGLQLGILGLGTIGGAVAHRAKAFGMAVGYHNRSPRSGSTARYFDSLEALADWSDLLIVCCPGGAATHHLVDAKVLAGLGPKGWLINVARGSVVDEEALVAALETGTIAGAGLDVFEDEPNPHPGLMREDVVLLPHIGSATVETREAMEKALVEAVVGALT
jgi:lactate dehydrogenase-like 2-hydroxyacid dehydrogenase